MDLKEYDLACLNCPSPVDFQDLIQILINKICSCCTDSDTDGQHSYEADLTQAQINDLLAQGYTVDIIG